MKPADLRVALFSGNYNYVRDGANRALNLLVGDLLQEGVAVRVYSPTVPNPAFAPTGDLVDVPAIPMIGGRGEYKVARGLPAKVRRDLEAFAPNLVHISAPEILGHRAVTWARRRGIPSVASVHTRFETYLGYYGIGFLKRAARWGMTRLYNRVDRVLVPGESMAAILRDWGVTTPIDYWWRGVEHDRFRPAARSLEWRRSLGIADDEITVGFVGRLVLEKGLDRFAAVVSALRERGVPHRVLVVGEGPARDWFAERVPEAVFTGFQRGDALARAIASMDVLFNPSVTETWGQVTSEAMAAGVPVVAARATGAMDLVAEGETGFLVTPDDDRGYAEAIARIATDPALRAAMGAAGHARAQRWQWDSASRAVLDVYLAVLGERSQT